MMTPLCTTYRSGSLPPSLRDFSKNRPPLLGQHITPLCKDHFQEINPFSRENITLFKYHHFLRVGMIPKINHYFELAEKGLFRTKRSRVGLERPLYNKRKLSRKAMVTSEKSLREGISPEISAFTLDMRVKWSGYWAAWGSNLAVYERSSRGLPDVDIV
jgi:hypothetical protein